MNTRPAYVRDRRVAKAKDLAAAFLAVTMFVGTAVAGAITAPYAAYADNDLADGALCTPSTQSMGTEANPSSDRDTGVATWVGGDMFVGKRPANSTINNSSQNNLMNANGPDASYAVEAEGLTVVNGKLLLNPKKNSWTGKGFRFGIAGFGTQFRPASGSSVLVVGGNGNTVLDSGVNTKAKVKSWTHPGFIMSNSHKGSLAGTDTGMWGGSSTGALKAYDGASLTWNNGDMTNVTVKSGDNDTDATDDSKNFSKSEYYQNYVVDDISAPLAFQTATGTVTQSVSTLSTLTRHKYNYYAEGTAAGSKLQYDFTYTDDPKNGTGRGLSTTDSYTNREKLITFAGTNNPTMEVFNLDASMLTDYIDGTRYRGVAFAFTNIADTASVVINVTGDNKNISFHNGWQFWWNGTEISDGYSNYNTKSTDENLKKKSELYAKAAQKILWNFHDTNNLTIYGGIANERTDKYTEDDPAAAMLGSIIVVGNAESGDADANNDGKADGNADNTTGNFESHVTTNGRVYTEGDFSMYNPYYAANFTIPGANDGNSSSVIDMDQERHNFPWNGQTTTECAAIAWQKADESGNGLKGTTWAIYGTYADAEAGKNALYTALKDDDFADKDTTTTGGFKVEGLKPNATYYIKEVATGDDSKYQLNTNIYYVKTGDANTTQNVIQSVTKNANGTFTFGTADMTDDKKIVNKASGHAVSWKKIADGDTKGTPLAGSSWQISKQGDDKTKVWNVEDNVNAAKSVTVTPTSTELNAANSYKATLTAAVQPSDAVQNVTWTFTDEFGNPNSDKSAAVLSQTSDLRADVIGTSDKDATVYVKACSVSNPDVCSQPVVIAVKAANVTSFTVKDNGNNTVRDNASFTVAQNGSLDFTAAVTPSVPIAWSTSNESVATVSSQQDGKSATVTMHGLGSAVITARAGNKIVSFTVATPSTTVYFKKSLVNWSNYYLYYDNGTEWTSAKMNRTCGDYVAVTIPQATQGKGFVFHDSTDKNSGNWYKPDTTATSNFKFTGNAVQVVELYNNSTGSTVPTACVASTAAADADDMSVQSDAAVAGGLVVDGTVADDGTADADDTSVAVTDSATADASADGQSGEAKAVACVAKDGTVDNDGKVTPGVKCDIDTVAGQFKVDGLDAGTYLIRELTAPDGYTLNTTVYVFEVKSDGSVEWLGGYKDGNTSGTLDADLKPGAGNAISDKSTEVTWNKVDAKGGKLDGSQWKIVGPLSAATGEQKTYCVADNVTVKTDGTTDPNTEFADCGTAGTKLSDASTESGTITVKGLPVGEYTLTETKAPNGYQLPENVTYKLNVVAEGTSTITKSDGSALTDSAVANSSKPVDIKIPVKKTLKYTDWPKAADDSFVKFKFQIAKAESSPNDTPIPADCNGADDKLPCTIDLAPESGAADLQNVTKSFGTIEFTDAQLGDKSDGDYAKTYTYVITEVAPTNGAVENLRYSKAEWEVKVTVSRDKDSTSNKYQGLKVACKVTQTKDDDGTLLSGSGKGRSFDSVKNGEGTTTDGRSGTADTASGNLTAETTFVNTKVLTGLPSTGTDWTGRMVLLAGAGFILAGMLIAGGYQFAKRREAVSA